MTKIGVTFPPVKKKAKDKEFPNLRDEQTKLLTKITPGIKINLRNKQIKEALELVSSKPGYPSGLSLAKNH